MNVADLQPLFNQLPALAAATGITIAGRKAITRLVTGVSDLAMLPIDSILQTQKDKREARSIVSRALADAVAKSVATDPELVERAAIAQLGEAARKQNAREKVAEAAIEELVQTAKPEEGPSGSDANEVDEDWMNVFVSHAEKASSERLQQMWGRVLAGQINKPGSFSAATLRTISELSAEEARNFEIIAKGSIGSVAPNGDNLKLPYLLDLESFGLVTGITQGMEINWQPSIKPRAVIYGDEYSVFVGGTSPGGIDIIRLTPVGRQCARLISGWNELDNATTFASMIKNKDLNNQVFVGHTRDGKVSKYKEL